MNNQIINARRNFERLGMNYPKSKNVETLSEEIEGVQCYWLKPNNNKNNDKLIIYVHGGGFVLGSIKSHEALLSHLADYLSISVLFIDYGLAPENPFPIAINQVTSVYTHIKSKFKNHDIILMGDSAGGGLSVHTISQLNKQGHNLPDFLILLSPWIDLVCNSPSHETNRYSDRILSKEGLRNFASMYVQNSNLQEANPKDVVIEECPPTLIQIGLKEILLEDSRVFFEKVSKIQDKIKLSEYQEGDHVWLLNYIDSPEAIKALEEIKGFILSSAD